MSIIVGVGAPGTVSGANGGKTYAFNNLSAFVSIEVAPPNPSRKQITFVNPGSAATIYVSMVFQISVVDGTQSQLSPGTANLGGTIPVAPGAFVTVSGECQVEWQGFAGSGSTNPFTVIDTNV